MNATLNPDSAAAAQAHAAPSAGPAAVVSPSASARLVSLDAYRGFIMVCLAFGGFGLAATARNHLRTAPDSVFWKAVSFQWEHVEWVGCAFWDLIQPSFMFMVGTAMAFSCARRQAEGHSWARMLGHACVRAVLLGALGIFLVTNVSQSTNWTFTNVLTQIALGYPLLFLCWGRGWRVQAAAAAAALAGTWLLFVAHGGTGVSPGAGVTAAWAAEHQAGLAAAWHKNANVFHAFDVWFLNLFPVAKPFAFNTGGYQTLNFLPELATMILGLMAGEWLRSSAPPARKLRGLLVAGVAFLVVGYGLDALGLVPAVKRIWTPSFGLLSTGWCLLMLAAFYWTIDVRGWRRWAQFLVIAGANSIALYAMGMLLKGWTASAWRAHLGKDIFLLAGPAWEPAVRACAVGLTFWLVCWWMWRRKIFLRL